MTKKLYLGNTKNILAADVNKSDVTLYWVMCFGKKTKTIESKNSLCVGFKWSLKPDLRKYEMCFGKPQNIKAKNSLSVSVKADEKTQRIYNK